VCVDAEAYRPDWCPNGWYVVTHQDRSRALKAACLVKPPRLGTSTKRSGVGVVAIKASRLSCDKDEAGRRSSEHGSKESTLSIPERRQHEEPPVAAVLATVFPRRPDRVGELIGARKPVRNESTASARRDGSQQPHNEQLTPIAVRVSPRCSPWRWQAIQASRQPRTAPVCVRVLPGAVDLRVTPTRPRGLEPDILGSVSVSAEVVPTCGGFGLGYGC